MTFRYSTWPAGLPDKSWEAKLLDLLCACGLGRGILLDQLLRDQLSVEKFYFTYQLYTVYTIESTKFSINISKFKEFIDLLDHDDHDVEDFKIC